MFAAYAENECGTSKASGFEYERKYVPGKMSCPKIQAIGCKQSITIASPEDNGGSPVLEYQL